MLYIPNTGHQRIQHNIGTTGAEFGTTVVAGGSAHTKNTTWQELITTTTYNSYGVTILIHNTAVASTRTGVLVDIGIGAASSEQVIIPNLMAGNASPSGGAQHAGIQYFFPIFIPSGVRIAATAQAFTGSDTVEVGIFLNQNPLGETNWVGRRVTAYGANTAASTGVSISPGNGSYTTGQITASTTNPIKYLQVGTDLYTNTAGTNLRGLIEILAASQVIVAGLPYTESTTVESVNTVCANMLLSTMSFDLPAGIALSVGAMRNGAAASRGWMLYGVD